MNKYLINRWKVIDLLSEREYEKHKHACVEAIKFLYSYTSTHFAEEEAYMREIGYAGYETHKKVHDEIKNETVTELLSGNAITNMIRRNEWNLKK